MRMAGVPFDNLERLATVETAGAARKLIDAQENFAGAKVQVEQLLLAQKADFSKDQLRTWRKAIRSGIMPAGDEKASAAFASCWERAAELATAETVLSQTLPAELTSARESLFDSARQFLPSYLVFAAEGVRERVMTQLAAAAGPLPARNKQARADERHLLLYLQRVAGKNDSLSAFGPQSWGRIDPKTAALAIDCAIGITGRETFLERWTAHGVAAAINSDPECRPEFAPRLSPNCRVEENTIIFTDSGERCLLDREALALLLRCDGRAPAYSLGVSLDRLETLAERNIVLWQMEVPALEPHAFEILLADITAWRHGPARTRWLEKLQPLARLPEKFARTAEPLARLAIIREAGERLEELGAHKKASRFLYSATNAIGEECYRECHSAINEGLIDEIATEAAPWIDLWRDNYAFVASRVAAGLRDLFKQAPLQDGALPLPAFLRHCAHLKMPLQGHGLVVLAHLAFREVKEAFGISLGNRATLPECQLTLEDCHVVRRNFSYEKFEAYTYPSADLQLSASSREAVARGDYQWILAELHPAAALLHHGFYWSCPDKAALSDALRQILFEQPSLHFGYFAADFTATTSIRIDALPELAKFVAPQRAPSAWQSFRPAETEVFIDSDTGDVGVRSCDTHEYLGSFARGWVIPLGFHPFSFSLGQHTPRLLCGKVVVQRRSWRIALEELGHGNFTGISRDLVLAVERLRAARELPRYIFIRPTEEALRRSGAEGRDKDTKPVFVDLESYLFLEIFHRWLTKAGELEVSEMLPTPDQLLWQEADGRRTFELRTLIVPR